MLIGLFADIHANRQAFSSCLAQARDLGAEQFIFLGDYVGYGAEPDWTVSTVIDFVAEGAIAVLGNHDSAVSNTRVQLNAEAQAVIEWTRGELGIGQRRFLADLPLTREVQRRLFVHAEASRPQSWKYVVDATDAARSINATSAHVTFCGHIHKPALYSLSAAGKMTAFTPTSGISVQLLPGRQWLAVLGSVGQPAMATRQLPTPCWTRRNAKSHTAARRTTWMRQPPGFEKKACRLGSLSGCSWGNEMVKPSLEPGSIIDGFRIEEQLHRGGMATLWRVSRPDATMPMLMKVPRFSEGEDSAAIVSFERHSRHWSNA